jgi:PadR family transcriptional regulator PadR
MLFTVNSSLLDAIVLSVVAEEDTYGYKITQEVNNIIGISESTLYPVLRRLQKDNNLEVYDMEYLGRNRRYYKITNKGRILLSLYKEEWGIYKAKIDKVFEEKPEPEKGKTVKIGEFIENLKINEKIENLNEKIDNMNIPEKIENLKLDEKIDKIKTEGIKIGKKFDEFMKKDRAKNKDEDEE